MAQIYKRFEVRNSKNYLFRAFIVLIKYKLINVSQTKSLITYN